MMKVSVVIPVHNAGPFLEPCLDSVSRQTLADFECVCIDDGSEDGSAVTLDAYSSRDRRFVIEHRANVGAAAARNRGLELATGEYVAFMDADDLYPADNVLELLYDAAKANGVEICGGGMSLLGPDGVVRKWNEIADGEDHGWQRPFSPPRRVPAAECQSVFGFTRFIYSVSMLRRNNIAFPAYIRYEDPVFFVRALAAAGGFYGIDCETYTYRVDYRKKSRSVEILRDYLRGQIDVERISRESGLNAIHRRAQRDCCGQEMKSVLGDLVCRDDELMSLKCELDRLYGNVGIGRLLCSIRGRLESLCDRVRRRLPSW